MNDTEAYLVDHIEFASLEYVNNNNFYIASDMWSFGIILYALSVGYTEFASEIFEKTVESMKNFKLEFPDFLDLGLKDLIYQILKNNHQGVIKINVNTDYIKNHSFFKSINWNELEKKKIQPPILPTLKPINIENAPSLSTLYISDYIVGDKDGYGSTFNSYNSVSFINYTHN